MKKITTLVWSITIPVLLLVVFNLIVRTSEAATGASTMGKLESSTEQVDPPWFDDNWHYRRPLIISSTASFSDYQVLIKLDDSNFDFTKADAEGWDVRFTKDDGTTEINYWIESWNSGSQLAYLWVKVPTIEIGDTTIYIYFYNPGESTTSDGSATFDFFDDDWCQFLVEPCPDGPWSIPDGDPIASSSILTLTNGTGISSIDPYQYKAVGFKANYGLGNGYEWGGFINGAGGARAMIRDLPPPDDVHDLYLEDAIPPNYEDILLERVGGNDWHDDFHVYELRWCHEDYNCAITQSIGDIDHGTRNVISMFQTSVPIDPLSITFYSFLGSNATLQVDWVYVRQYNNPEPTVTIGTTQGLVDLSVVAVDSPDPLYAGEALTYLLTISNTSSVDAIGVTLTDTLPGEVNFASVNPSQGTCNSVIVCALGTISANLTASITVVVTTTIDGVLSNSAVVSSQSYDSDFSNNTHQEMTTVLPSADLAIGFEGYPESLPPEGILTYIITVTNLGPSNAETVSVMENLPTGVEYQSSSPEICNEIEGIVTCPLGSLAASMNVEVQIISKVIQTTTGNLDSSATVVSNTHDPNPTNNINQETNIVDADKPVVNWLSPVQNEQTYITGKNMIMLVASATDSAGNDQIAGVEFRYWDHINQQYVDIGAATTNPYQVEFGSNSLKPGEIYQVFVQAFDQAGNISDRKRIFIERINIVYFPLIEK